MSEKAETIIFGLLLVGKGKAWVDDLKFEVVGKDVPSTDMLEAPLPGRAGAPDLPDKPVNLDFEEQDAAKAPRKTALGPSAPPRITS